MSSIRGPRSPGVTTVWTLGPADIDIVASLGDSITAGTGSKAENIFGVLNENRGSTYMTGADEDWRACPSIHNFLKQYNPNVIVRNKNYYYCKSLNLYLPQGGSYGSTNVVKVWLNHHHDNGLNLSVSAAITADLMNQARELVRRIRNIRGWQFKWKMVIFIFTFQA